MTRQPERDQAKDMWLESDGKKSVNEIAQQLNQKASTVRGWKSRDDWDAALDEKHKASGKRNVRKPSSQARKGNQNAKGHGAPKGNKGGTGAPKGNKNGLKHGAFERFAFAYMDDEEKAVANETEIDGIEEELLNTLAFLKARELRLMKRRAEIISTGEKQKGQVLSSVSKLKSEKRMGLWRGSIEHGYEKEVGTGMYDGEWLDETTTNTTSVEDALNRLEAELSKVQAQKVKILTQLDAMKVNRERLEIERIRAQGESEQSKLATDWVEALLSIYADSQQDGDAE